MTISNSLTDRPFEKILIAVGICLLVIGLLFKTAFFSSYEFSWISAVGFFLGSILSGIGFLALLEFYSANSVYGKIGFILATASLLCFSSVLVRITRYAFDWLACSLVLSGICLFIAGIILRAYSN